MNPADDVARLILKNLAWRLRQRRKELRRYAKLDPPSPMLRHFEGAATEAWNSFQAAKQIYYEALGSR